MYEKLIEPKEETCLPVRVDTRRTMVRPGLDPLLAPMLLTLLGFGLGAGLFTSVHNLRVRNREKLILHEDLDNPMPTIEHTVTMLPHIKWPGSQPRKTSAVDPGSESLQH